MDKDKAIRSAKLTAAGILDKRRAKTAVERAGGQIAPSKYLPGVPRQVHAAGGPVAPQGYSLKVDPDRLGVLARFKGKNVGQLTLSRDRETGKLSAFQMAVHPDHQRKGLMSAMHNAAEQAFGPMEPDKTLTDDGFAFWKGYRPDAVSNNLRFHTEKLMGQTVKTPYGPGTVKSVGSTGMNAELESGNTGWARASDNEDVLRGLGIDPSTIKYASGGRIARAPGGYVPQASIAYKSLPVGQAPAIGGGTSLGDFAQLASMMGGKEEAAAPQPQPQHHQNDGHDHSGMSDAALQAWGKLTDAYGKPLTVNSAYRDPQQNAAAHGAKDSQHLHGNAYDVDTSNMSYEDRLALADMAWNSGFRGVGFYDNSMHFDVADPRSWGPSHSRDSIPEWAQGWASQRYGYAGGGKVAFMQGNHPAVPDVLYHGSAPKIVKKEIYLGTGNGWKSEIDQAATDRNIAAQDFRTFRPSEHGNYGPGIYLTDNPKTASDYAQGIRADQSEVKPHGQVMKLHVSMKQPFHDDVLKHPSWIDYIKQELTKYDLPHSEDRASRDAILSKLDNGTATVRDIFVRDTPQGTMINQHGQDDVLKTIRNSGYDGIIAHRPDGSKEIVAFQPEQVKSAIGNQGTFDPSNPDMTKAEGGPVVNLGKEKLVRSITKAVADVKSGAHQEGMDQRAHKLHESGHLPLPIGTKVTPPQGWDMPSELHIHGYWQDILHPDQHGYKLKSENGDLYEVQHQMHSGQNPYVFGGGFKAYSGPVRNRAGYSDEAMAPRNPTLPTRTPEQSDQLNKEYDQLFGNDPDMTKATGGPVTDNENFASWFGNSVTHTDGEPHVFYTGTSKDKDFTAFNVGRHGAWFTRDPEVASSYAAQNDSQGYKWEGGRPISTNTASRVIPAYVKAENPYTGEYSGATTGNYKSDQSNWFDSLRAKGHDAWIPASSQGQLAVVLREPQQIKSIYNNGNFDTKQKHMGKAEGGEVDNNNQGGNQYGQTTSGNRQIGTETQGLPVAGGVRGGQGLLPAPAQASGEKDLIGLPTAVKMPKLGMTLTAGHDPRIRAVARDYAQTTGLDYNPPTIYQKVDPERAKRIAAAYDAMPHDPDHPLVKASYSALLNETLGQYQAMKRAGMKMEFYPDVNNDPYKSNPRLAVEDVRNNNHMYVYPTDAGFGSGPELSGSEKNPMLGDSGERWNGKPVMFNDLFRAVHDYFGHAKEGVGFRADGEENAWRSHAAMFSPLARIALGTETRGQNSWLNYGPHGEKNRTATTEDTVFADQKLGILPEWAHHEGAEDFIRPHERQQMQAIYRTHRKSVGGALDLTSRFTKNGAGVMMSLKSKGK